MSKKWPSGLPILGETGTMEFELYDTEKVRAIVEDTKDTKDGFPIKLTQHGYYIEGSNCKVLKKEKCTDPNRWYFKIQFTLDLYRQCSK